MDKSKITLAIIITVATIYLFSANFALSRQQVAFRSWVKQFGKVYQSKEEQFYRLRVFSQNLAFIEAHNQQFLNNIVTYEVGLNQFSDITNEQYKAMYLMTDAIPTRQTNSCVGPQAPTSGLPVNFTWTQQNAVTSVKTQGQCNSGYAFAVVGSSQAAHFLSTEVQYSLSTQQVIDCSSSTGNQGCTKGSLQNTYTYVINSGLTSEQKYAYTGKTDSCKYTKAMKLWDVVKCTAVTANELSLRGAVHQQPVSAYIDASQAGFKSYKSGIYSPKKCGTKCDVSELNHAVLIVGFSQQQVKTTLKKKTVLIWRIKNSYGVSWGQSGYMKIERLADTSKGTCCLQASAFFAID